MKFEEIKELMRLFGKSKLEQIVIEEKDFKIKMKKAGSTKAVAVQPAVEISSPAVQEAPVTTSSTAAPVSSEPQVASDEKGEIIVSPMVGTFYEAPSPDSPPFVKKGDTVRKGQTLCILEAMKIMNEVEAEYDCRILDILVKDGEPVEYDKPLFRVERL